MLVRVDGKLDKLASGENEIDLIIEEDGTLYPVEIKMSGNPKANMASTNQVLDKVTEKKRGMGPKTTQGCIDNCAIHTIFPGGCAVVAAEEVTDVEGVEWLDLGMPEAMWRLKADRFGPLIVSIDSYGNNLIENNKVEFNIKREKALEDLKGKLSYME